MVFATISHLSGLPVRLRAAQKCTGKFAWAT
jgi:hypothetical protein